MARLSRLFLAAVIMLGVCPATALAADAAAIAVTTKSMPEGTVELKWTTSSPAGISGYEVHRSASAQVFEPSPATRLYRLPVVTSYLDGTATPGTSPWYRITALGSDGQALATSPSVKAVVPASPVDKQRTSVLSALPEEDGIRLSWRAAAGAATPLKVYAGPAHVAEGNLADAKQVAASEATASAATFHPKGHWARGFALVDADGKVLDTATPARTEHPRTIAPETLAKVRRVIKQPGTPQRLWQAVQDKIEAGRGSALDTAFAYAVTGDRAYVEQSFTLFQQAAATLRTQQGLEVGNTITMLAPAYDLAYNGWTAAQRTEAQEAFKYASAYMSTFHSANIDTESDKTSNWVVIIRGSELAMHLAVRGDGDFGLQEHRIPVLVDDMRRNLDDAYGDSGWDQEGYDYLSYTLGAMRPIVTAVTNAGMRTLDRAWERPRFAELVVRSQSLRPTGERLQFGVGERTGSPTSQLLGTGSPHAQAAYLWLYERIYGKSSVKASSSSPADPWALINWPEHVAPKDPDSFPELRTAQLDDQEGSYFFRNRSQGDDDVLVGVSNRNRNHFGWSQAESFALNIIGQGTTWARQPAKENTTYSLFSKPLIDGKAIPPGITPGRGSTKESRPYQGQGGGFVSLEAAKDYGIDTATRDVVTDLRPIGGADAVIAVHDHFTDDASHRIDWQLSPEPGVEITHGQEESGAKTFLFRREDAWLKGWLLDPSGAAMSTSNGAFQITRNGTEADFRIVLATGRGPVPAAKAKGDLVTLGQVAYDTANLASFTPDGPAPVGDSTRATIHLSQPQTPFTPGETRSVTAQYTWWAPQPAEDVRVKLDIPEGWTAKQTTSSVPTTLRRGQQAVVAFDVTAPVGGTAFGDYKLAATGSASAATAIIDSAPAALIRTNLALGKPSEQSSTQGPAERANDGNTDGIWGHNSVAHTLQEVQPWWQVDLGESQQIGSVTVWNRVDCCAARLHDFYVLVSDQPFGKASLSELLGRGDVWSDKHAGVAGRTTTIPVGAAGRYVRIQIGDTAPSYLITAEIQVSPVEVGHLAQGQPATQSSTVEGAEGGLAVDGETDGPTSATQPEVQPWWHTDLGESAAVRSIEVWNTSDAQAEQLTDYYVLISDNPFASGRLSDVLTQPGVTAYRQTGTAARPTAITVGKGARYIRIQLAGASPTSLSLAEVRVLR